MSLFSPHREKDSQIFVAIHGHFYQPPRENPWLNYIERQSSAYPFHDWNERITYECYMPNTASRVLDANGLIIDIVNNFDYMNFNIGPTLFNYIEKNFSEVYKRIIEADKRSVDRFNGHGNAIAQVYNHIILPLADDKDIRTQIEWGVYDFERRFGRAPESIWLSETAINYRVLRHLISFGFKYIILSPFQAEKIRRLNSEQEGSNWIDVSDGSIDPRQPYRHYWIDDQGSIDRSRYIDIFFYDSILAHKVSFAHLLRSADGLYNSFLAAVDQGRPGAQLIHYASDGENYGHHEPFGDMALSYFFKYKLKNSPLKVTNYGEYLEKHPPEWEVILKPGPGGEGTAWSCAHGVGRWYRDCGCNTGGQEGWNQKWRTPLRQAFDFLRDAMREVYETRGKKYLKDIWQARDRYIAVIDDRRNMEKFFKEQVREALSPSEKIEVIRLLEGQRYAMYMYTSCAWFFSDVSGLETIQNMKYADMAFYHYREFFNKDILSEMTKILHKAKSNVPHMKNGEHIYKKYVLPGRMTIRRVLALFLIKRLIKMEKMPVEFYDYKVNLLNLKDLSVSSGQKVFCGTIAGRWKVFNDMDCCKKYKFMVVMHEISDLQVYLDEVVDDEEVFSNGLASVDELKKHFKSGYITLRDLIYEEREIISEYLLDNRIEEFYTDLEKIFRKNEGLVKIYNALQLKPPKILLDVSRYVLSERIYREVKNLIEKYDISGELVGARQIMKFIQILKSLKLNIDESRITTLITEMVNRKINEIVEKNDFSIVDDLYNLLKIVYRFGFKLELSRAQNIFFDYLNKIYKDIDDLEIFGKLIMLARYLGLKVLVAEKRYSELNNQGGQAWV